MYEESIKFLKQNEGQKVQLEGSISDIMWQHLQVHIKSHPNTNYFDLEDGFQIIAYSKEPMSCESDVEIQGEIKKIERKKDLNSNTKIQEDYSEYYLIVDSWKCID